VSSLDLQAKKEATNLCGKRGERDLLGGNAHDGCREERERRRERERKKAIWLFSR